MGNMRTRIECESRDLAERVSTQLHPMVSSYVTGRHVIAAATLLKVRAELGPWREGVIISEVLE